MKKTLKLKDGAILTYPFEKQIDEIVCDGTLVIKTQQARIYVENINIKASILDLGATTIVSGTSQIEVNTLRMMRTNSSEGGLCFNGFMCYPLHVYEKASVKCDVAEFLENPPHAFKHTKFSCNSLIVHRISFGFNPIRIAHILDENYAFYNVKFKKAWVDGHVIKRNTSNNMEYIKDMDLDEFKTKASIPITYHEMRQNVITRLKNILVGKEATYNSPNETKDGEIVSVSEDGGHEHKLMVWGYIGNEKKLFGSIYSFEMSKLLTCGECNIGTGTFKLTKGIADISQDELENHNIIHLLNDCWRQF